ncbi:MAG: hypothetical protein EBV03_09010 [Proteobacteria bacterium]|nr:hypothetical protein [Pseudomonadota bacterium]
MLLRALLLLLLMPAPALAVARGFHPPATEMERKLDSIIMHVQDDGELPKYILRGGKQNNVRDAMLADMFTPELMKAFRDVEANTVYTRCGGQYQPGEDCGINYNPITCLKFERGAYLYRTESAVPYKEGEYNALIAMKLLDGEQIVANYMMVKVGGQWKLDGVDCAIDGDDFNL